MDQILALAPSIRPPMLPVVSRQNTTSTFGFAFLAAGAETAGRHRPAPISRAGRIRRDERDMALSRSREQDLHSHRRGIGFAGLPPHPPARSPTRGRGGDPEGFGATIMV